MTTRDTTPAFRAARAEARSAYQDLLANERWCIGAGCKACGQLLDTFLTATARMNELRPRLAAVGAG